MFGNFTSQSTEKGTDWGEQMLNSVARQSIAHLFSESKSVDVVVRCQPSSKLLQGRIDSFKMSGSDLVIRRQFPVAEMSFETDAVALDFGSILSGQIRLKQPTQAVAEVSLTEAGINQAFQAELVTKRLLNLDTPALTALSGGTPVSFPHIEIRLLPANQLQILAKAEIKEEVVPLNLTVTLGIEKRRRIVFKNPQINLENIPESLQTQSQALATALCEILDNMVDLDRFDLDGVMLRLNRLQTQGNQLLFSGYAQIEHFPRTA